MPVKRHRIPRLGSVSHGTARTPDLLRAFADTLAYYRGRGNDRLIKDARELADCIDASDDIEYEQEGLDIVIELSDKLNEIAPDYVYFGSHEGDGSDFGFWPVSDAIDQLPEFILPTDARKEGYTGDFRLQTSGETFVYRRFANGRIVNLL